MRKFSQLWKSSTKESGGLKMTRYFHKRKTQFWAAHYLKYLDIEMHIIYLKVKT